MPRTGLSIFSRPRFQIRLAREDDADALASLHVRAWQWAYRGQLPDGFLDGLSTNLTRRASQWRTWLASPDELRTWLAECEGSVVGFAQIGPARDRDASTEVVELYMIYLEPAWVGKGVGARLFSTAEREMSDRGFKRGTLWVLESNDRGRRFYEKFGWQPDGTRRTLQFPGFQADEVRYSKYLAD